jgi:hypothetical protein
VGFARDPAGLFVIGDSPDHTAPASEDLRRIAVLNKFGPSGHGEAQVQYMDGDFRVISPGTYVRCAVTDERIPLDELKYWSVDLQEAYAVPTAVLKRHFPDALKASG